MKNIFANILTRNSRLCSVLCVVLLVVSCSSNDVYLDAKTLPPIAVPGELDNQALGQIYPVPEGDGRVATGELSKPLPPSLSARQVISEPRVQSFGNQSWLLVPKEAAATWSQLILFLQSRKVFRVKQDVRTAEVQTSWITEAAPINVGFRYQIRLEPSLQQGLTEVHVTNIQGAGAPSVLQNLPTPLAVWPQQSQNKTHEQWFLKQIAKALSNQKSQGDSLVASSISFSPKVVSTSVNGEPVLNISLSAARTYNSIGNGLKGAELEVYDFNEDFGVFYVNEGEKDKDGKQKKKFTERLKNFLDFISTAKLTRKGLVTNREASYSLDEILSHLPQDAVDELFTDLSELPRSEPLSNIAGYLLVQRQVSDNQQRIYIRDGYGRPIDSSKAKQLLDILKQKLF